MGTDSGNGGNGGNGNGSRWFLRWWPIIAFTTGLTLAGMGAWSSLCTRMEVAERAMRSLEATQSQQQGDTNRRLERIEDKIDRLIERGLAK